MIRLHLGATELTLHPLAPLMALLALRLGLHAELAAILAALTAHEAMHLAAAKALGVPVLRLELLPFGGAIELGNLYALARGRLALVALAGPAGNLLLAATAAALAWGGLLPPRPAALLVRADLMLMLANLLPALPLDGGRVLYAMLEPVIGAKRALATGLVGSALLVLSLLVGAIVGLLRCGRLNLTLLLAAVFIAASGVRERDARRESASAALAAAWGRHKRPRRLRTVALDAGTPLLAAAKTLRAGEETLYALFESERFLAWLDQDALLRALERDGALTRTARDAL